MLRPSLEQVWAFDLPVEQRSWSGPRLARVPTRAWLSKPAALLWLRGALIWLSSSSWLICCCPLLARDAVLQCSDEDTHGSAPRDSCSPAARDDNGLRLRAQKRPRGQPARGTRGVPKRQAAAELVQVHLGSKQLKAGFVWILKTRTIWMYECMNVCTFRSLPRTLFDFQPPAVCRSPFEARLERQHSARGKSARPLEATWRVDTKFELPKSVLLRNESGERARSQDWWTKKGVMQQGIVGYGLRKIASKQALLPCLLACFLLSCEIDE